MRLAVDLSLPADARMLGATRKVVAMYLVEFGAPEDVVDDVILAVDEACTNVLKHAFPDGSGDNYRLVAVVAPDQIQIDVIDHGVGFDAMSKPARPAGDGHLESSGRGLEVMRRLMTTVEVESPTATGGTRLRLVRKLPPTAD